jgi:rhodanese-related sulfurtransferase
MSTREKITAVLVALGILLVILPGAGDYSFWVEPDELVATFSADNHYVSVDRVAAWVIREDSTVQLIDLRSRDEFAESNIPGSINVPLESFFDLKPETWLHNRDINYIFYSNGEINSGYALVLARGLGYENTRLMAGGLNEWFKKIMNSSFTGERITPAENALFETRFRARRFYTEINSLPDSLKLQYAESRRQKERNLDGGCD